MSDAAGFRGGSRTAAAPPTAVGGSMGLPGSGGGIPTAISGGQIHEARNNRGSNVQVPYGRVVPLHGANAPEMLVKDNYKLRDMRVHTVRGEPKLEYDGLNTGQVAWILGRRHAPVEDGNQGTLDAEGKANDDQHGPAAQRRVFQAGGGAGRGVDRMQRLATTEWVEARFKSKEVRSTHVHLHKIHLGSSYAMAKHAGLQQAGPFVATSTAVNTADVTPFMLLAANPQNADSIGKTMQYQKQGIFFLDKGPFLRGVQASGDTVGPQHAPRNQGDALAFGALETELRRRNIFDWTPDGVVLSAGDDGPDPINTVNLDARSARVYNVAVQGPATATTWTTSADERLKPGAWDVEPGTPAGWMDAQPGERVFICLVADVSWQLVDESTKRLKELQESTGLLRRVMDPLVDTAAEKISGAADLDAITIRNNKTSADELAKLQKTFENKFETGGMEDTEHFKKVNARLQKTQALETQLSKTPQNTAAIADAQREYDAAVEAELAEFGEWASKENATALKAQIQAFEAQQRNVRKGFSGVKAATLSNFRLMRTTSVQMTHFSSFQPTKPAPESRMGLKLCAPTSANSNLQKGVSEYIVGAWCIGRVLDSRATRVTTQTVGSMPGLTRPKNVALKIQVNVEWWNGDALYKNFMDTSGMVLKRGGKVPTTTKRAADGSESREEIDVDAADKDVAMFEETDADNPKDGGGGGGGDAEDSAVFAPKQKLEAAVSRRIAAMTWLPGSNARRAPAL